MEWIVIKNKTFHVENNLKTIYDYHWEIPSQVVSFGKGTISTMAQNGTK